MKKIIAVLLALVMMFSMASVTVFAADDVTEHISEGDEEYESVYTLLNFFADLLERLNLLFEYIATVFGF